MMECDETVQQKRKSTRSNRWLMVAWWVFLLAATPALLYVLWSWFFAPPPATFLVTKMVTPVVTPNGKAASAQSGGIVQMAATVRSPIDPSCLIITQFFITFSDGTTAFLPGLKLTTKGEIKRAMYITAVPKLSARGPSTFKIREIYNCGLQVRRVESPALPFMIGE